MIWFMWAAIVVLTIAYVLLALVTKIKFDIASDVFDLQLDIMHALEKDIHELKITVKYMDAVIPLPANGECLHPDHPEACAYPAISELPDPVKSPFFTECETDK